MWQVQSQQGERTAGRQKAVSFPQGTSIKVETWNIQHSVLNTPNTCMEFRSRDAPSEKRVDPPRIFKVQAIFATQAHKVAIKCCNPSQHRACYCEQYMEDSNPLKKATFAVDVKTGLVDSYDSQFKGARIQRRTSSLQCTMPSCTSCVLGFQY